MNYKTNYIEPYLKHTGIHSIKEDTLKFFLWYTMTKHSRIQRDTSFDGGIFDISCKSSYSSSADYFFQVILFLTFKLDELHYYPIGTTGDLDSDVDSLNSTDINKNLLYLNSDGLSSLFSLLRDSAHANMG